VADSDSAKEISMQVRVAVTTRALLDQLSAEHGVTAKAIVGRLLDFFASQPTSVRNALLYPGGDPVKEIVQQNIGAVFSNPKLNTTEKIAAEDTFEVMLAMVKRMELLYKGATKSVENLQREKAEWSKEHGK
jgi:hypothetical protein